uniref:hypothetical protein n=1 Tax=Alcaligenes xylosoxydans xylosoxydans TaxID=85698 RepID=UPI001C531869
PAAVPSDSVGLIDAPRMAGRRRDGHVQLQSDVGWGERCAWRSGNEWGYGEGFCGDRLGPAAQAAFRGFRGILRLRMALRVHEASVIIERSEGGGPSLNVAKPIVITGRQATVPDGWRARESLQAQTAACRAPPITAPPTER